MQFKLLIIFFSIFLINCVGTKKIEKSENINEINQYQKVVNDSIFIKNFQNEDINNDIEINENINKIEIDSTKKITILTKIEKKTKIINKVNKQDSIITCAAKKDTISFFSNINKQNLEKKEIKESKKLLYIAIIAICIVAIFLLILIKKIIK